jgi:hypothetical protein
LAVPAHILAVLYAGQGFVLDASLTAHLQRAAWTHLIENAVLALLLLVTLLLLVMRTHDHPWRLRFAFALLHADVTVRALIACQLVFAGADVFSLGMLAAFSLVGLLYQGVYSTLVGIGTGLADVPSALTHGSRVAWLAVLVLHTAALVSSFVTVALHVWLPFMDLLNTTSSATAVQAMMLLVVSFTILAGALIVLRETLASVNAAVAQRQQRKKGASAAAV